MDNAGGIADKYHDASCDRLMGRGISFARRYRTERGCAAMSPADVVVGDDGLPRCSWAASTAEYAAYHDGEWARPVGDENGVYERLCLEGFQAGLSWLTILRKRQGFRQAFASFDPVVVARFDGC
jgi:hypothetical protein